MKRVVRTILIGLCITTLLIIQVSAEEYTSYIYKSDFTNGLDGWNNRSDFIITSQAIDGILKITWSSAFPSFDRKININSSKVKVNIKFKVSSLFKMSFGIREIDKNNVVDIVNEIIYSTEIQEYSVDVDLSSLDMSNLEFSLWGTPREEKSSYSLEIYSIEVIDGNSMNIDDDPNSFGIFQPIADFIYPLMQELYLFGESVDANANEIEMIMQPYGEMITKFLEEIPMILKVTYIFGLVFIVIRKVVGR